MGSGKIPRRKFFSRMGAFGFSTALTSFFWSNNLFAQVVGHFGLWKKRGAAPAGLNITISANTQNFDLRATAMAGPYLWDGISTQTFNVTVNSGIYVWSDSTSLPAFDSGTMPVGSKINIFNSGFIIGRGGNGMNGFAPTTAPTSGGPAINVHCDLEVNNTAGYIGGGGGGGGGYNAGSLPCGGGGAGGGLGGSVAEAVGQTGSGGSVGAAGADGAANFHGGGGGRIIPGTGGDGALSVYTGGGRAADLKGKGGGAGGGGALWDSRVQTTGTPRTYTTTFYGAAGGGGWGAAGGNAIIWGLGTNTAPLTYPDGDGRGGTGGAGSLAGNNPTSTPGTSSVPGTAGSVGAGGGAALQLNGFAVTWVSGAASSSRAYGAVS